MNLGRLLTQMLNDWVQTLKGVQVCKAYAQVTRAIYDTYNKSTSTIHFFMNLDRLLTQMLNDQLQSMKGVQAYTAYAQFTKAV